MFNLKKQKIFCIGRNKTGTTSMGQALKMLGYRVGKQKYGELLIEDWGRRDFRKIIQFCKSADAFQDVPFSLDDTYKELDKAFPGSKFILTTRTSADEWFDSLIRFETDIIGKNTLPTAADLKNYPYRETGWLWRMHELVYGVNEEQLYDMAIYIAHYEKYNNEVLNYFNNRPDDFLILNLNNENSMQLLCGFLHISEHKLKMPHLNKSKQDL